MGVRAVPEEVLNFHVAIDPALPEELSTPVVAWGAFRSSHPGVVIYDGDDASCVSNFYVDMITGRPMPLQFVTRSLDSLACLFAITLFLDRNLALSPKMGAVLSAVNMVSTLGVSGIAHVDRDLSRLLVFLDSYILTSKPSKKEMEEKLSSAVHWVREYILEGRVPSLPPEQDPPSVFDVGTNGFVLAKISKVPSLILGVVELYRLGHLRGVLFGDTQVLAFKKSRYLRFDLQQAQNQLDLAEKEAGGSGGWSLLPGDLFLASPRETRLSQEFLTQVFLRV